MTFVPVTNYVKGTPFNSETSANFKEFYEGILNNIYREKELKKPSQTFAPSSFRCDRMSFFRLRGVEPDQNIVIDPQLEFSAVLGTACHREIQQNLKNTLVTDWVSVRDYLEENPIEYDYSLHEDGFETLVSFSYPPIRFSCDGIIRLSGEYYLLEIKTSEYQSFNSLSQPKESHIDQIKCYCALLNIEKSLVLYQDRLYGSIKCFEVRVNKSERDDVFKRMNYVIDCVEKNIAPPRLNKSDYWCTYCKYKQRCKQWS